VIAAGPVVASVVADVVGAGVATGAGSAVGNAIVVAGGVVTLRKVWITAVAIIEWVSASCRRGVEQERAHHIVEPIPYQCEGLHRRRRVQLRK